MGKTCHIFLFIVRYKTSLGFLFPACWNCGLFPSFFFFPFSEFSVVPFGTMVGFPSRRGNILSSCILGAVLWFWPERGVCQNGSSPFKSLVVKPIVIYYPWLSSRRNLPSFPQIFGVSDLCPWAVSPFLFALFF